jgi:hypothetical protein
MEGGMEDMEDTSEDLPPTPIPPKPTPGELWRTYIDMHVLPLSIGVELDNGNRCVAPGVCA